MGLAQLSNLLWRERDLLEGLLLELEERMVAPDAGEPRRTVAAPHGVDVLLAAIDRAGSLRAAELDRVAHELGLPLDSGLHDLAGTAPDPWGSILNEHLENFLEVSSAIAAVAGLHGDLISRRLAATARARAEDVDQVSSAGALSASGQARRTRCKGRRPGPARLRE